MPEELYRYQSEPPKAVSLEEYRHAVRELKDGFLSLNVASIQTFEQLSNNLNFVGVDLRNILRRKGKRISYKFKHGSVVRLDRNLTEKIIIKALATESVVSVEEIEDDELRFRVEIPWKNTLIEEQSGNEPGSSGVSAEDMRGEKPISYVPLPDGDQDTWRKYANLVKDGVSKVLDVI
ncbi:hypothetical protein HYT33_01550 [Candidatus Roizmanbacteria bacterium]|nr:hypothetical protein [Candidatus Roizmanbacteria bacterium]